MLHPLYLITRDIWPNSSSPTTPQVRSDQITFPKARIPWSGFSHMPPYTWCFLWVLFYPLILSPLTPNPIPCYKFSLFLVVFEIESSSILRSFSYIAIVLNKMWFVFFFTTLTTMQVWFALTQVSPFSLSNLPSWKLPQHCTMWRP